MVLGVDQWVYWNNNNNNNNNNKGISVISTCPVIASYNGWALLPPLPPSPSPSNSLSIWLSISLSMELLTPPLMNVGSRGGGGGARIILSRRLLWIATEGPCISRIMHQISTLSTLSGRKQISILSEENGHQRDPDNAPDINVIRTKKRAGGREVRWGCETRWGTMWGWNVRLD